MFKYNFSEVNFDQIEYLLSCLDLESVCNGNDIDLIWQQWKDKVFTVINNVVPKYEIKPGGRNKPWINYDII